MKGLHRPILLAASLLARAAFAQPAELSLPGPSASPGANLLLPVSLTSHLSSIGGLQFDLQYDSSVLTLTATVGNAIRDSAKTLYAADLTPGNKRFLIAGLAQDPIVDGDLINLFVSVSPSAPAGPHALQFSNVMATDPSGLLTSIAAAGGVVTVGGAPDQGSRLQPEGVLNAASLLSRPIAPGEIVTLLGAGIGPAAPLRPAGSPTSTILNGTSVLFDGTPAPLLYASPYQVNAIAPYGISGNASTRVEVTQGGQTVAGVLLPVAETAAGIFTLDGSGVGQAAILNQDQSLNSSSNPAPKGSVIALFATGAGQTDPPGVDGQIATGTLPAPLLPVSVQIGDVSATVLYAGAAPLSVAGLLQVNCIVPQTAPSGLAVPIVLFVGATHSQTGVTLAIR